MLVYEDSMKNFFTYPYLMDVHPMHNYDKEVGSCPVHVCMSQETFSQTIVSY